MNPGKPTTDALLDVPAIFTGIRALENFVAQHVKENHCGALPTLPWLLERKMCASFAHGAAKHYTVNTRPNPMDPSYPC
jgi:hypothetical protein